MHHTGPIPNAIHAVDTLIGGDILRIITEGTPLLDASTPQAALEELRRKHDALRKYVIEPPRGHADINACLLFPPFEATSIRTAAVAAQFGFGPVAGTALMSSTAALAAMGEIPRREGETSVRFDTAKGPMDVAIRNPGPNRYQARWRTTFPEVLFQDRILTLPGGRELPVSLINSGMPYLVARAADLEVDTKDIAALGRAGAAISQAGGAAFPMAAFGLEGQVDAYLVIILGDAEETADSPGLQCGIAWIAPSGWVAPSPAGTGALATLAHLSLEGALAAGQALKTISPAGNGFTSRQTATGAEVEAEIEILSYLSFPPPA